MARWIKVDVDTPMKPAMRNAAADCAVSRGDAFLAFFRLYSWLDENTADGVLYASREELDGIAQLDGFAASLERSGWLSFDGDLCTVANWDEHNGQNARRRAENARRMAVRREEMRRQGLQVRPCPFPPMPTRPRAFGRDGDEQNVHFSEQGGCAHFLRIE